MRKTNSILLVLGAALLSATYYTMAETPTDMPQNILGSLKIDHPRLIWTDQEISLHDDLSIELAAKIIERAESVVELPPLKREKEGHRLLAVSREAFARIITLATAYRLEGDPRYAEAAERIMLNVASFTDWNPKHFLDVAEMTAAVAIGYDWFYRALDESTRAQIREAIIEKGIKPSFLPEYETHLTDWTNNWNQVCNGGIVLGALAVADEEPELAARVVRRAIQHLPVAMAEYAPDGVYPEGPGYWSYGTHYNVILLAALDSALGNHFGLDAAPGFMGSSGFIYHSAGPSGQHHNFSDLASMTGVAPALYWMAQQLDLSAITKWQDTLFTENLDNERFLRSRFTPLALIWRDPATNDHSAKEAPLAWIGHGANPVAYFRSGWEKDDLFLGIKAGSARVNHGHMDVGSFVLDRDGLRWVLDPSTRRYIEFESAGLNLWNMRQDSARWKIHECGPFSHATLTIDGQLHTAAGKAKIVEFCVESQSATIDLSETLSEHAVNVTRTFQLLPGEVLQVTDRLKGLSPNARVRWAFSTHAGIEIAEGHVTLRQSGHELPVTFESSSEFTIRVEEWDIEQPPFRVPVKNTRTLIAEFSPKADGTLTIQSTFGQRTELSK